MPASPKRPVRRTLSPSTPLPARVRLTLTLVALLGASVAACSDDGPTGVDPMVDPFLAAQFSGAVNAGTIKAIGNTWNPLTHGSDAAGRYITRITVDGTSSKARGINFVMPNANTKIQL